MFQWVSVFKDYFSSVTMNMVHPWFHFDDVLVVILDYVLFILEVYFEVLG